jgi:hypothetical protein
VTAPVVLDASALLARLFEEPGADVVDPLLPAAVLATVGRAEVWQKLDQHGVDAERALRRTRLLGLRTEPFSDEDAVLAARLWPGCVAARPGTPDDQRAPGGVTPGPEPRQGPDDHARAGRGPDARLTTRSTSDRSTRRLVCVTCW